MWSQYTYGLIITDLIYLPHGGVNFIRAVRRQDDRIPILAITGYGQETAQEALDAGADHVLFKPFHLFQVREAVERLLG
jgi:DNA-binding response OmpR family regulator